MNEFLKTYKLALTPLSPIHIGCGEDFEPTNYVIEDGVLYGFDPSRAALTDVQRGRLAEVAAKTSLLAIQRFFRDNAATFKLDADVMIPVSHGVNEQYEQRIGRAANVEASGNSVFNNLFIERATYTGARQVPYIPASSFKGCIRTTWLDALNAGSKPTAVMFKVTLKGPDNQSRRVRLSATQARSHARKEECVNQDGVVQGEALSTADLEKDLLQGDFSTSPFRLFKPSDLMATPHSDPARRVLYAVNLKKRRVLGRDGKEAQPKGIAARKECILHGQYRAFSSKAVLQLLGSHSTNRNAPARELQPTTLRQIAKYSNAYQRTRLQREMKVLDGRGLVHPDWKNGIEKLLNGSVGRKLESGDAFLIRLGRYGGAESKTLSGEGVASIKIMGAKGQPPTFESATKTVWLAAEHENDQRGLLPFGWAIVEIDPQGDLPELKAWCEQQARGRPDMAALREQIAADRLVAEQRTIAERVEAEAKQAARQAQQTAEAARLLAFAAMSPQAQDIETLRQKCEALANRIAGGNFKKQAPEAGKAGLYQDALTLSKKALESTEWTPNDRRDLAEMLEQWLPRVIGPWDAKEQRKKLKLAALKGIA